MTTFFLKLALYYTAIPRRGQIVGGRGVGVTVLVFTNQSAKNKQATFVNKRPHLVRNLFMFQPTLFRGIIECTILIQLQ